MAQLRKLVFPKLRSSSLTSSESQKERLHSMSSKSSSVNQEYTQALRTKSYEDMCTKVQSQIRRTSIRRTLSSPSPSTNAHYMVHLSESLLEPGQETLTKMIKALNFHRLLVGYFEASSEACDMCELLLRGIYQTRTNYQRIRRAIKLSRLVFEDPSHAEEQSRQICQELSSFASLTNPLSAVAQVQLPRMHDNHVALFRQLMSKCKQMRRRMKLARACKRVRGLGLIVSSGLISTTSLVLTSFRIGMCNRKVKSIRSSSCPEKSLSTEGVSAQLDVAAKGVFILINDMDTISRWVGRLHDEVEHGRSRAGMAVRNYMKKGEIVREVAKEFDVHNACFLGQLEELEEHIYLCLLTMNRSRRLVVEEILISQSMG
ncbi:hypothetical protein ACJRO7_023617 [Eucalyptus globulus]|uniref:Uncharacterized protein n=1 Tax=Eucalyptus globulus TaxID=34317 RepID=A0ABD3K2H8_EUCGL